MNIHVIKTHDVELTNENEFGETPLPYAPVVESLGNGHVVPQQYLNVKRTLSSVESILAKISVPDKFLLFAKEENGLIYLVPGILGCENYATSKLQSQEVKLVYGRRWLLEPSTPTSEVVQTAILSIKKAREHELRERFVYQYVDVRDENAKPRKTTPFNCHMDLPLMVVEAETLLQDQEGGLQSLPVENLLSRVRVDNLSLSLYATNNISDGRILYDIDIVDVGVPATGFADMNGSRVCVLTEQDNVAEFLHELFNALLKHSNDYVDEHTHFDGFARFSKKICPNKVAHFSYQTRNIVQHDQRFEEHFDVMNYRVDAAKAPSLNSGALGELQRSILDRSVASDTQLAGYLPHGYKA